MTNSFTHLHNHSCYSLRDAIAHAKHVIEEPDGTKKDLGMVKRAVDLGYKSLALTDHGSVSGLIPFYKACTEYSIKPILGVEAYYTDDLEVEKPEYYHLIVLAKSLKGYRSLLKATTFAYITGLLKRPMMNWEAVNQLEDVIITTACIGGILTKDFLLDNYSDTGRESGIQRTTKFMNKFGNDFYVEIQWHSNGNEKFETCNEMAMEFAKQHGIDLVLTNDLHFTRQEDMPIHKGWVATRFNKTIANSEYVYDETYYLKSPDEMMLICPEPSAFYNTMEIDSKIDWIDLNIGVPSLPNFENLTTKESNTKLIELVKEGLRVKSDLYSPDELQQRITRAKEELQFIIEYGFSDYFLHVWRLINEAKRSNILVGPGRGSCGGSMVAYLIGITNLDPIKYGLLFTRFLNPGRVHKKKKWTVELNDGTITDIIEDQLYHIKENEEWVTKLGQDIIATLGG